MFLRDDKKRNGRECCVKVACIHFVGGSGGMPAQKSLKSRVSEMLLGIVFSIKHFLKRPKSRRGK